MGFELPHIAAYLSVAAELSVARVYVRCASSAPFGAPCPLGSGLGKQMPGALPCYYEEATLSHSTRVRGFVPRERRDSEPRGTTDAKSRNTSTVKLVSG